MKTGERITRLEGLCGHSFKDKELLERAVTHPSAVENQPHSSSYERLEFLGDSILGAIVADALFRLHPDMDEGALTRLKIALVSGGTLSDVAEELGLSELIVIGESERGTGARGMHSALENVYEALVGALYLDGGVKAATDFVSATLMPRESADLAEPALNAKSHLQELTQRILRCAPEYRLVSEEGPAHDPTFTTVVFVEGRRVGRGTGSSKKASETAAAKDAIERLELDGI